MQTYTEIEITLESTNPSLVTEMLWELEPLGIEDITGNKIKLYFPGDFISTALREYLDKLIAESLLASYTLTETILENKNWNEEWEKTITVNKISDTFVIKPSFRDYEAASGEIVLTIDPKMSFGTGEHQTTKLMILALEKYCKPGDTILDIGTGTGVLAIAAIKLGAASAIAFDNDEWCNENGKENCQQNNVENLVEIRTAELHDIPEKDFSIVIANIQRNPLLELSDQIAAKAKSGGIVLLSGLLREDEPVILEKYSFHGLKKIATNTMDEWISLVFIKE